MRATLTVMSALMLSVASAAAQPRTTLDIYVTDVEGGNGTLFVTPAGESVLIDTGNANGAVRDAGRIMDAVRDAHLTQIDHLIITHYHGDHFGGLEELSKQIPIKEFIDHGPNVQPGVGEDWTKDVYPKLYAKGKHTVAKPGDRIQLAGIDWRIVASAGAVIPATTLPGVNKPNPACANYQDFDNNMEDPMSVASYITFGKFRTAQCQGAAAVTAQAEAISSAYANSGEYGARNRTATQYVSDMYNAFLRRAGDLAGVQFWINQIATGARTRENVRQQFVGSPEFSARVQSVIAEGCLR